MAVIEITQIEKASKEELVSMAKKQGMNLSKYEL